MQNKQSLINFIDFNTIQELSVQARRKKEIKELTAKLKKKTDPIRRLDHVNFNDLSFMFGIKPYNVHRIQELLY